MNATIVLESEETDLIGKLAKLEEKFGDDLVVRDALFVEAATPKAEKALSRMLKNRMAVGNLHAQSSVRRS